MRRPKFFYSASRLRATGRLVVAHHLQRAWWRYTERCDIFEAAGRSLATRYQELWRRGPRGWSMALALAPVALVAALSLTAVILIVRGIGVVGAGVVLLLVAGTLIAPVLGATWALTSFTGNGSAAAPARAAAACDASYPEFCIAPDSADLDCPNGGARPPHAPGSNFAVRGADIHMLDGDEDGIGCESSLPANR